MIFETERLILRPWDISDAEECYKYARDPLVGPICGWREHTDIEHTRRIIRDVLAVPETYAIVLKETGLPVGSIGLHFHTDIAENDGEAELGYWLGVPYWGRGIAPEAAREVLHHAFEELGVERVWCGYYDGNEKSKRVQEKLGFKYQWTNKGAHVAQMGETRVCHVSLLTREEWASGNRGTECVPAENLTARGAEAPEIKIEKASREDAEAILDFLKICGAETDNLSFDGNGLPISVEQERAFIASLENSDKSVFFVARDGDEIVGTANYSVFPGKRMAHRGELGVTVRKSHWRRGIGTMLMERALDFAKNTAGSEIVSLEVRSDNAAAVRLYEKFGFEKIGTFIGYFKIDGKLVDFDIMELFL